MAKVNIYVPDDLKARMDRADGSVNWSEIARSAFLAAVAAYEHRTGQAMTSVVERLRASKSEYSSRTTGRGSKDGREWAENKAEYEDLLKISRLDSDIVQPLDLWRMMEPDGHQSARDFLEEWFGDANVSDDYVRAFVEGAQEVFADVADQL